MESMRDEIRQFVVASEHLLRIGMNAGELSRRAHWAGVSMECTAIDPSSRHEYKGRTISLFVSQPIMEHGVVEMCLFNFLQ